MTNPLWQACLDKVAEMEKEGWVMMTRSAAYVSEQGPRDADQEKWPRMCIYKAYAPGDRELAVSYVFEIKAGYSSYFQNRGGIEVRVKGPYEDSHDAYWLEQRQHDGGRAWIVTPNYCHYVVHKDRTGSPNFAGYGGRLFVFEFIVPGDHVKFKEAGLKVLLAGESSFTTQYHNDGEVPRLYTRNLWHQGYIPPKHRHLWTPNAEIVPAKPITVGL